MRHSIVGVTEVAPPPGHISEGRSKTMPPNTSNAGQVPCKVANFTLDRMKNAKLLAEKAIKV